MPRTPEQFETIRNEKRKIILDTALELFANNGYASTSISQIAQKANISKGLMYNYFESKEELLKTIIINLLDELITYLDSNNDNKTSEEEALMFIDKYFEYMMTRTEEFKLFCQFSIQPDVIKYVAESDIAERGKYHRSLLIPFLEEKHKEKTKVVLLNFSSVLKGIVMQYVFMPEMFSDELIIEYREYVKDIFIRNI